MRWFILAAGTITMLGYILIDPVVRTMNKDDLAGVKVQTGTAQVVIQKGPGGIMLPGDMHPPAPNIVVRFHGQLCTVAKPVKWQALKPYSFATITYRVGHSGHIYVDSAVPAR